MIIEGCDGGFEVCFPVGRRVITVVVCGRGDPGDPVRWASGLYEESDFRARWFNALWLFCRVSLEDRL